MNIIDDQRQLVNAQLNFRFDPDAKSKDKEGIVLKVKNAIGRTDLNDRIIVGDEGSDSFVRVKSCINNRSNIICGDEIARTNPPKFNITKGAYIGVSFASSLVEQLTQAALGLKHGGKLEEVDDSTIKAVEPGKVVDINGKFITVQGNHLYKYRLTNKTSVNYKIKVGVKVTTGQVLANSTKILKFDNKVSIFNTIIDTNVSGDLGAKMGKCMSYAPVSGVIMYNGDGMTIGEADIGFDENEIYFYPEGYSVDIGTRICTGILDVSNYLIQSGDVGWTYYCFYDNMNDVFNGINSELLETLFKAIKGDDFSVVHRNRSVDNIIDRLYYGDTKSGLVDALIESTDNVIAGTDDDERLRMDVSNSILLPLIMNAPQLSNQ